MESDFYAQLFGAVIGGMVGIYLIGKLFELLFFNRFIKNSNYVIAAGSIAGFLAVFLLWMTSPTVVVGFPIFSIFIAAIILSIIRIQWRKRKTKREIASRTEVLQKNSHTSSHNSRVVAADASEKTSQLPPFNISTDLDDPDGDAFYTIVAEELESGNTDKGLWTRLFAECGGDEKQVKALYITRRVEKMMEAEKNKKQLLQKQVTARLDHEKNTLINIKTEVKKRVWPKVLGGLVLVVVVYAGYYEWDQKRVKPATGLNDIELSMRQEDVTARFGRQPDFPPTKTENEMTMFFDTLSGFNNVTLKKDYDGIYRTARICRARGYIANLSDYESEVLEKLGKPDSESFSENGTFKIYNFKKYNLSLTFSGGERIETCVMRDPNLVFTNAFKPG